MAYELRIKTGTITVPIYDQDDNKIGFIRFNPTDIDILKRYNEVIEYFQNLKADDIKEAEDVIRVSDEIKEQINHLFNCNASEGLFSTASPLSPMDDGTLFFENVLDAIRVLMDQVAEERMESVNRVERATKGYE